MLPWAATTKVEDSATGGPSPWDCHHANIIHSRAFTRIYKVDKFGFWGLSRDFRAQVVVTDR